MQVSFNNLNGPFNPNRPTYVITHGFQSSSQESWVLGMANDLLERDPNNPNDNVNANVFSVDWSGGANNINYWKAVSDTVSVGNQIADYLIGLGANPDTTQFIGHSLGAHVSGIAADRYDYLTGKKIEAVIALDAAGPSYEPGWFSSGKPPSQRLDPSDAKKVIAFHTSETLGYDGRLGHLDFYVNWDDALQPGQWNFAGNHSYAHQLYSELLRGYSFTQPTAGPAGSQFNLFDVNNLTGSISVDTSTVA